MAAANIIKREFFLIPVGGQPVNDRKLLSYSEHAEKKNRICLIALTKCPFGAKKSLKHIQSYEIQSSI